LTVTRFVRACEAKANSIINYREQ